MYYKKIRASKTEIDLSPIDKMDFSKCCKKSTVISVKNQDWRYWCRQLVALGSYFVLLYVFIASLQARVFAQITPDDTLPNNSSVARDGNTFNITGGTQAGNNLFHSFGEFSVPIGGAAIFNNALDIQNIISRVTGGSASKIDGLIRTSGTANLFLINPYGIIFGRDAKLDIGGSFVGTTASAISFGNQGFFNAINPNTPELLTVNPSAFLFNQIAAAPIQNNSVAPARLPSESFNTFGLRVPDRKSLLLLGGNVNVDGGRINAFGGRVELGGLASSGTVGLNADGSNLSLGFPAESTRADVFLTNKALVYVTATGGGSIAINARNLDILQQSFISAGIERGLGSVDTQAGDVEINAQGTINLANDSFIENLVGSGSIGRGGDIRIETGSLYLTNYARIAANIQPLGEGDAGNISINARATVNLTNDSFIESGVLPRAVGNGGDIRIETGSLDLTNGAQLVTSAFSYANGNAGSVNINARDSVSFDGASGDGFSFDGLSGNGFLSGVLSIIGLGVVGKGGDINITTGSLAVTNRAVLNTSTSGQGNAGSVNINARDTVSFNGRSGAASFLRSTAVGKGGDINITTGSLAVTNGAELNTSTSGQGNAGSVNINARDTVFYNDGKTYSNVQKTSTTGKGGDIRITSKLLSLTNGSQLNASTGGQGDAGNIIIDARNTVSLQGVKDNGFSSLISTSTFSTTGKGSRITISTDSFSVANGAIVDARTESSEQGGSVTINANTFEANNGGQVTTTADSTGQAGNITLNVTNSVTLSGSDPTYTTRLAQFSNRVGNVGAESGVFASTNPESEGKGGDIIVSSRKLNVQDSAKIVVNSQGTGEAGNIEILSDNLTLKNQALILAQTVSSQGGNIDIRLKDILLQRQGSQISTSAGTARQPGDGGNITITAPNGFIIAVANENSDITANAFTGKGGRVRINASGIYGIGFLEKENPQTSDITASSEFGADGTVELNTPEVDPNSGLVELPTIPVDTEVAQGCYSPSYAQSSFVINGRGGLPPNPKDILTPEAPQIDWVSVKPSNNKRSLPLVTSKPTTSTPKRIVEATGATLNAKGQIVLSANSSTVSPHTSRQNPTQCHGS